MSMSRRQIYALRIKLARCALSMSVREFAEFVDLSPNTITSVESAKNGLNRITDIIDEKLSGLPYLKLARDDGQSVSVKLNYVKRAALALSLIHISEPTRQA